MTDEKRCPFPGCGARLFSSQQCSTASGQDHVQRIRAEREGRAVNAIEKLVSLAARTPEDDVDDFEAHDPDPSDPAYAQSQIQVKESE